MSTPKLSTSDSSISRTRSSLSAKNVGSHKGDSPVDTQAVSIESSRKRVESKVVRLQKGSGPVDHTSNTEESGNESSQTSSASEPESVARSHKGASLVDTTSGRQSCSHWGDSTLGSRRPPAGNESSPCGSSRSPQGEAETGRPNWQEGMERTTVVHMTQILSRAWSP